MHEHLTLADHELGVVYVRGYGDLMDNGRVLWLDQGQEGGDGL